MHVCVARGNYIERVGRSCPTKKVMITFRPGGLIYVRDCSGKSKVGLRSPKDLIHSRQVDVLVGFVLRIPKRLRRPTKRLASRIPHKTAAFLSRIPCRMP